MTENYHFKSITYTGLEAGISIIITGAVHGNEKCGTQAITRVMAEIDSGALPILRGKVTFVPITNPKAYAKNERVGDRNLNRNLTPTALTNTTPKQFEDHIANWLCPLFAQHDGVLDLHSTRAKNTAFAMLGPQNNTGNLQPFARAAQERTLAKCLGINRFVDGWLNTYAIGVERRIAYAQANGKALDGLDTDPRYGVGTTEYMRSTGGFAITLECGQHDDPQAPEVGYRAIRNALAHLQITGDAPPPEVAHYEVLHMFDVIDKHHVDDTFSRAWASFDALKPGDLIGTRADGSQLLAEFAGCILFPDTGALPGNEWFYLTRTGTVV
jgi:predicted deacylase